MESQGTGPAARHCWKPSGQGSSIQIRKAILKLLQSIIHVMVQECWRLFDLCHRGPKGEGLFFGGVVS